MSLETALQEHTQVMRELLARLTAGSMVAVATPANENGDKPDATEKPSPASKQHNAEQPEAEVVEAIDYEKAVRPVLVKVSTSKGRDALIELLAKFGAAKGDQLKPAQFGEVIAAANDLLAA